MSSTRLTIAALAVILMAAVAHAADPVLSCKDNAYLKGEQILKVKYAGNTKAVHKENADKCMKKCVNTEGCQAASYKQTGWCYLLSEKTNFIVNKYDTADRACKLTYPTSSPPLEPNGKPVVTCKDGAFLHGDDLLKVKYAGNTKALHKENADRCLAKCLTTGPSCRSASYMTTGWCYLLKDEGGPFIHHYSTAHTACRVTYPAQH